MVGRFHFLGLQEMGRQVTQSAICQILAKARSAASIQGSYPFLSDIVESLEAMQYGLCLPRDRRERIAGGVGRLVTEDMDFAESPLGLSILELADDFASGD
jgi:hypothetical protein